MVDCIVSTAGGIEEDFIKCMAPTYVGRFDYKGKDLRKRGMNRIGNLIVPNDNYCKFEDWMMPILNAMVDEQTQNGTKWTPSKMINRLGKEINNEEVPPALAKSIIFPVIKYNSQSTGSFWLGTTQFRFSLIEFCTGGRL